MHPDTITLSPGRALPIDSDRPSGTTPIPLSTIDDLGVAGDEGDAGLVAGRAHRRDNALEIRERQSLFENKRGGEEQRRCPADRKIIHRAAHGQLSNVSAGEEERANDE
jgi:hypothetical protein